MGCSRNHNVLGGALRLAVVLALGAPVLGSCGGSSRNPAGNANGGVAGGNVAGAATAVAGTHSAGGSANGGSANGGSAQTGGTQAGGTPAGGVGGVRADGGKTSAGDAASGGAGEASGDGGAGGADSHDEGWPCGNERCSSGQTCTRCLIANQNLQRCVPNPDQDPTGYANATAACETPPYGREDCNGPEDCKAGQYCVAYEGTLCQAKPSTKQSCCFFCNAITDCTLCHTNQDCPAGETCEPNQGDDSKGCRRTK